jgi:Protein of unknown function DUF262
MSNNIPSVRRIGDLIDDVADKRLIVRPFFQRRQVWNNADKERFIDTILQGYPFPEIFIAEGKREGKGTRREKLLVDGQQRLSTAIAYYQGSDELLYRTVPRFQTLTEEQRTAFLDYVVAVRDLGTASNDIIREIFNRINSTDYALKSMEILNAMYSGAYKQFCEQLSRDPFFDRHKVFPEAYKRRMLDLNFCVILVTTLLSGYYKRDERNKEYLERYNEEFPQVDSVRVNLDRVFDFVERCDFEARSRAWRQTDLFTLLVELHTGLVVEKLELDPAAIGQRLKGFYAQVDGLYESKKLPEESAVPQDLQTVFAYLKAATKATNDKYTRVERARIISDLICQSPPQRAGQPALASVEPPASPSRRTRKKST